jgi:hypothetical protein
MIKEVSVYHFVDDHYDDNDQQPNPPVGNKMLPHTGSIGFANRFVKLSKEEAPGCARPYGCRRLAT